MKRRSTKGTVCLHMARATGTDGHEFRIKVTDDVSGELVVEATATLEQGMLALTSQEIHGIPAEFGNLSLVGRQTLVERVYVDAKIGDVAGNRRKVDVAVAQLVLRRPGCNWAPRYVDADNHHRRVRGGPNEGMHEITVFGNAPRDDASNTAIVIAVVDGRMRVRVVDNTSGKIFMEAGGTIEEGELLRWQIKDLAAIGEGER